MALSGWNTPTGRASTPVDSSSFKAAPSIHAFSGLLFDMDGTIIDSTAAVVKHWNKYAQEPRDYQIIRPPGPKRRVLIVTEELEMSSASIQRLSSQHHMDGARSTSSSRSHQSSLRGNVCRLKTSPLNRTNVLQMSAKSKAPSLGSLVKMPKNFPEPVGSLQTWMQPLHRGQSSHREHVLSSKVG
jgi:hypothetical protein